MSSIPYNPKSALDVLLHRLFDYAGMFPPTQLSFEQALRESASLTKTLLRPWMVGSNFVLDTAHARKIAGEDLPSHGFTTSLALCVLASEDTAQVIQTLETLVAQPQHVQIAAIETKVSPDSMSQTVAAYAPLATSLGSLLAIEPDLSGEHWKETLSSTVELIVRARSAVALKCRCSGPTGIGPDRLAAVIVEAGDAGIACKVTGGLHHPIVESDRYPFPTGFLNVVLAVMFRRAIGKDAPESLLLDLLRNRSISDIKFDGGLTYRGISIDHHQLIQAKNQAHFSIGSCSLHEPDSDLARLVTWVS